MFLSRFLFGKKTDPRTLSKYCCSKKEEEETQTPQKEKIQAASNLYFSRYLLTVSTKAARLQVSGLTETGLPSMGSSCSASIPEGRACFFVHKRISFAFARSERPLAAFMYHWANHNVHTNQGFPGIVLSRVSCL